MSERCGLDRRCQPLERGCVLVRRATTLEIMSTMKRPRPRNWACRCRWLRSASVGGAGRWPRPNRVVQPDAGRFGWVATTSGGVRHLCRPSAGGAAP